MQCRGRVQCGGAEREKPGLRFVYGFAAQEGGMQCRGAEREIPVLKSVCSAVEPNGPALKGVDGCGKEKRGVEGAAGGVEGRGIALVGRCPRG